jgi:hypothetical protein
MKETWAHFARCVNYGGNPGCVATWSHVRNLTKVGTEMTDDLAQLTCAFNDKAGVHVSATLAYQLFDL